MDSKTYIIELPGKPSREVTNIKLDIVEPRIIELGGTIRLKPESNPPPKHFIPKQINIQSTLTEANKTVYSYSDIQTISQSIANKYFNHCSDVLNCPVTINNRIKRYLGWAKRIRNRTTGKIIHKVELSPSVICGNNTKYLHQVIYHEFCHVEFPTEGHRGINFRNKEKENPYREKKTNRLSKVS